MMDFRRLKVWEQAHLLTLAIYRATKSFPREELYGLTNQMRRCAASVAANIAEGCGKNTNAEFCRYLQIAAGSASELEYHLLLARDLGFIAAEDYAALNEHLLYVRRMLTSLVNKIQSEQDSTPISKAAKAGG